ncbi:glycosyltransferase family 4 protein [Dolichospermum sp. LEGE 00240]|uniref:glycosyltransferase family 4 protein n=1 Tax=Dolichospermum sp. LEGE 00240 TaxID=1828603 RepID=UPI00188172A0|nr:glycosyltransferase family 4 protein [Dolichospermum sp. LEGE 00240]MBE9248169.1 glycosyltransferase family 4 protein [Dolichospermum sp. LEGE 00240]
MKHILFYDDVYLFGGHQVTAIDAVKYLLENTNINISFIFYEGNTRLCERLNCMSKNHNRIELYPISFKTPIKYRSFEILLFYQRIKNIRSLIRSISPDVVVVVQGYIELSSPGLIAAKKEGKRTISFIPMAKKISGKGIKELILNNIQQYLYRLPDKFITTSTSSKNMLLTCGASSDISVVYYGPDTSLCKIKNREESRIKYGISKEDYILAIIGRVQFVHKAQDFLVQTLLEHRQKLENIKLFVVGDGPDELQLRKIVQSNNMNDIVTFVPWENDLSYIYSAIDMLVIPSWYEGLPLVMLEAMYYGLPIIASDVDGMAEVLPNQWLFKCGDSNALIETFFKVMQADNSEFIFKNNQRILSEFNVNIFGENFLEAIENCP